jgi:hypothetical protein
MKICMGIRRLGKALIPYWRFRLYRFGCPFTFTGVPISIITAPRRWLVRVTIRNPIIGRSAIGTTSALSVKLLFIFKQPSLAGFWSDQLGMLAD